MQFGEYCSFRHEENNLAKLISDNQKSSERLSEIERIIKERDNLEIRIDDIDKKIASLDEFMEHLHLLESQNKEKERKIEDLEKKIVDIGEKLATLEKERTENDLESENKFTGRIEIVERKIYKLEKRNDGNDFCEFCDDEFEDEGELRLHTRDNHTFECNVCEIRLGNHEELNMHLLTCEIYKCYICDYKHKRLSELKTHIKSKHGDKKVSIQHFKMNKEDFKRKTCTRYSFDDI